ncbi:MAG: HNH endonuclease [Deinococcales bacterium]
MSIVSAQCTFPLNPFVIEHIIPLAKQGTNNLDNLALACHGCNSYKHIATTATDPANGIEVDLFHPRQDNWHKHFTWNYDASLILGLSPKGRATIVKLKLNRKGVVNLRKVLANLGLHPPNQSKI